MRKETEREKVVLEETKKFVRNKLKNAEGGHDWWHVHRVWKMALHIAKQESADEYIVQLAALLHDIADPKFYNGNEDIGPEIADNFLKEHGIDHEKITAILYIIRNVSFKNSFDQSAPNATLEFKIIQDADRLDAIGAIGIARAFNYGGFKNRLIYDPDQKPKEYENKEEYKRSDAPTINHFYEKLLLLKDQMHTETGKKLALQRHKFMLTYLEQFYMEWDGRK